MKKNILLKTNLLVCLVIIIGFLFTSVISYQSNQGIFHRDMERVSQLTAEGIYHHIDMLFTKPINISLTMANDKLLKDFLREEETRMDDPAFMENMRSYLETYREKYDYDSVFLISSKTNRYYHFNGLDRVISPDSGLDDWYYELIKTEDEYGIDIDDDKAANHEITVFVNCKINGHDGKLMGVVGVGFRVSSIQELLKSYEDQYDIRALMVDNEGYIAISTNSTGYQAVNMFEDCPYAAKKDQILSSRKDTESFWYPSGKGDGYLVSQYIPAMKWHLLIENDAAALRQQLSRQLALAVTVICIIILLVLLCIGNVIRRYKAQIVSLTVAREKEHRDVFQKVTEKLYEDIYEIDVTHDRAASEATEEYFESLGVPKNTLFHEALHIIAEKQIKAEFREGYIAMFSPEHVMKAYQSGEDSLCYDFMISNDGSTYYWMRINARIFRWKEDDSVRMMVYRQNIDAEKQHERFLLSQMQKDSLTGIYNKVATQEHIRGLLSEKKDSMFAFYILDIDNFKQVNDEWGHAVGDVVLREFAGTIKDEFGEDDVVGRIGGDEFVAFMPVADRKAAEKKAGELNDVLHQKIVTERGVCTIAASVGVAVAPEAGRNFEALYQNADIALYQCKKNGKNGFAFFEPDMNYTRRSRNEKL